MQPTHTHIRTHAQTRVVRGDGWRAVDVKVAFAFTIFVARSIKKANFKHTKKNVKTKTTTAATQIVRRQQGKCRQQQQNQRRRRQTPDSSSSQRRWQRRRQRQRQKQSRNSYTNNHRRRPATTTATKEYFSRSRIEFRYFVSLRLLHTSTHTLKHTQTQLRSVRERERRINDCRYPFLRQRLGRELFICLHLSCIDKRAGERECVFVCASIWIILTRQCLCLCLCLTLSHFACRCLSRRRCNEAGLLREWESERASRSVGESGDLIKLP